jgi:hypothetical protein
MSNIVVEGAEEVNGIVTVQVHADGTATFTPGESATEAPAAESSGGGGGGFLQGDDLAITANVITIPAGAENVFHVPVSGTLRGIDFGDREPGTIVYLHLAGGTTINDANGTVPADQRIRLNNATGATLTLNTLMGFMFADFGLFGGNGVFEISRITTDTSEG